MSNQYIKKIVNNERTQANITGMSVDTQSRYLLNPTNAQLVSMPKPNVNIPEYKNVFLEKLEEFATWAEDLKIKNEQTQLQIDLQKMDLELETKWQSRENTDKYREAYEEYTKERMKVYAEKQKLIQGNKYIAPEYKQELMGRLKVNELTSTYNQTAKRSKIFIPDQIADTHAKIEQIEEITMAIPLDNDNLAEENYKIIANSYKDVAKLTGEEENVTLNKTINSITKLETERLHKDITTKLNNPNSSLAQKKAELEKLVKHFENPNVHEELANDVIDKIGIGADDKEQALKYIKASFSDRSKALTKQFYASIKAMEREEKAEARARAREHRARQLEINMMSNKIRNSQSYEAAENFRTRKTSKGIYFPDRINQEVSALESGNIQNSHIYHITGKTPKEINARNEYIKDYVPTEMLENMSIEIGDYMEQGYTETNALIEVSKKYANKNPEMTKIIVNSLTQNGGYSKSVDIALKAEMGDPIAEKQKDIITLIEKRMQKAPKMDQYLLVEHSNTEEARALVNKLVKKGVNEEIAKRNVALLSAGTFETTYRRKTKKQGIDLYDVSGIIKKEAKKTLKNYSEDEMFIESMANSITPRKKLKSTTLEGDFDIR